MMGKSGQTGKPGKPHHLRLHDGAMIEVLEKLSEHLDQIVRILQYMSRNYFDFIERLSDGSCFHLQRELDGIDNKRQYRQKLDEFLQCYAVHKREPSEETRRKILLALIDDLKGLNDGFVFNEKL